MSIGRHTRRLLVASFCLVLTAGCGGSGGGGGETAAPGGGGDGLAVTINNDLIPPQTVTVFIVPETGRRRRLGSVPPNSRQTFNYDPTVLSMEHTLVGEAPGVRDKRSLPFTLQGVRAVRWDVSNPNARLTRGP